MLPLVYALVLNRNGERWLPRCLGSLLQTRYGRLKVVLLDNGSTDGSLAAAESFPSVEIIRNGANLNFSEANNLGIRRALAGGAAYVALLNNDVYVEPEWLLRIVEAGETRPDIGILSPVQLVFDGASFNSWTAVALRHMLPALRERDQPGAWLGVEWVEGSSLVAKRSVFDTIGLLDPLFSFFFEECDFCRRARAAGFQIAVVPASKIHHYRGGTFGQPSLAGVREFLMLRGSMLYNSTDPEISLLANLKGLLQNDATHLKTALLGTGALTAWCRANASVLRCLPAMYRKWRADRAAVRTARQRLRIAAGAAPSPVLGTPGS
jgi:GT2 family glycosyltransferase